MNSIYNPTANHDHNWNPCGKLFLLLVIGIEGLQNTHFLQLGRELRRYRLDILGLSEVTWWDTGKYSFPSCSTVLSRSIKSNRRYQSSAQLLLMVNSHDLGTGP